MRNRRSGTWTIRRLIGIFTQSGASGALPMAYEYPSAAGTLRLERVGKRWLMHFAGHEGGRWPSPDIAAKAVARHESGMSDWDRRQLDAPEDLLDWRPLGESL